MNRIKTKQYIIWRNLLGSLFLAVAFGAIPYLPLPQQAHAQDTYKFFTVIDPCKIPDNLLCATNPGYTEYMDSLWSKAAKVDQKSNVPPPMTVEQKIRSAAKRYGVNPDKAVSIAKCESGLWADVENHRNKDGTNDKGVFQINSIHRVPDSCSLNEDCNIEWAMKTMKEQGLQPWYSSQSCWDKK